MPHPAVRDRAHQLAQEVLDTPTNVASNAHGLGGPSHEPAGYYAYALPEDERTTLASKLIDIARDSQSTEYDRANAIAGLHHLAPTLSPEQRSQLFEPVWSLVDGLQPGDLDLPFLGSGSLRPAVLRAGATLATTPAQISSVLDTATALLADDNLASGAAQALVNLKAQPNLNLVILATHRHTSVRQAAAVLWSRSPEDPDLGRRLASDEDPQVRTRIAEGLRTAKIDSELRAELFYRLQADPDARVRRAAGESISALEQQVDG